MADTQAVLDHIPADTPTGYRLTPAAVERLKQRLGVHDVDDLAAKLGLSRMTFWRLRNGRYDIRLSRARQVADLADMPLNRAFEAAPRG